MTINPGVDAVPDNAGFKVSVVVPQFNEEEVLSEFKRRRLAALAALPFDSEIVYVDDGSTDATPQLRVGLQDQQPAVSVARLSRNFGK